MGLAAATKATDGMSNQIRGQHKQEQDRPAANKLVQGCQSSLSESLKEFVSYRLAFEDPWLERFDNERDELLKMELNCQCEAHTHTVSALNKRFILSTLKLIRQSGQEGVPSSESDCEPANRIQLGSKSCSLPSRLSSGGGRTVARLVHRLTWPRLLLAAMIVGMIYVTLTFNMGAYVIFLYDVTATRVQQSVARETELGTIDDQHRRGARAFGAQTNANRPRMAFSAGLEGDPSQRCTSRELVKRGELHDERRLLELERELDSQGMMVRSQLGVSFLGIAIIGSTPFLLYLLPMFFIAFRSKHLRLDTIALLYEPLKERRRLLRDQQLIVEGLVSSFRRTCAESERLYYLSNMKKSLLMIDSATALKEAQWLLEMRGEKADVELKLEQQRMLLCSPYHPNNREHLEVLATLRAKPFLMRPMVINSQWQCVKLQCSSFLLTIFPAISFYCPLLNTFSSMILELRLLVGERFRELECSRWHPDGVLLRPSVRLNPLEPDQIGLYEQYDGSWAQLMVLMFRVEASQVVNLSTFVNFAKLLILVYFLSAWSVLWTTVYMVSCADKMAWLTQLKGQLDWCINEVRALNSLRKPPSWPQSAHLRPQELNWQTRRHLLLERLTIAYVNYQLYHHQVRPFRTLATFLLFQACAFTATSFGYLYLIAMNIGTRFKFFSTFSSICVIIFLNIYLVMSSFTSKLMEDIMRRIIRLLGELAHLPELNLLPAIENWRRQLLSEQELNLFTSTRLFGLSVSYKRLVAFNTYLAGIYLLLWRATGVGQEAHRAR